MSAAMRWPSKAVALATCALVGLPVIADLRLSSNYRPFGYAAGDTFYYLGVARNVVEHGSISTDGAHATNGFHPLWQLISTLVYAVCRLGHCENAALLGLILTSLLCAVSAVWLLACSFYRANRRVPISFVTLPIGVYAIAAAYYWRIGPPGAEGGLEGPFPVYGTLYSFVNGMESGLTLLAFAQMMCTFLRHQGAASARAGAACGASCAFLCFSRLDHAAFVVTPALLWAIELFQPRARRRFLLSALAAAALPVVLYCAVNQWYAGSLIPISGAQKSTFPMPYLQQLGSLLDILRAPLSAHSPRMVYRILPILFCSVWTIGYVLSMTRWHVGASALVWSMRPGAGPLDIFLVKMAPGVLLLSIYDLLFVYGIGHWYFPVSVLYCSLTLISACQSAERLIGRPPTWVQLASGAALAVATLLGFYRFQYKPSYHRGYAEFFYKTSAAVRSSLSTVPTLLEDDDGIVAYGLGVPSVSGRGYLLDLEASHALSAGHLFEVSYHRGVRAIASLYYASHELRTESSSDAARSWAAQLLGNEDLSGYDAKVLYGDSTFTIVGLEKSGK